MARPKKQDHEKRTLRLPHIRVTAAEFVQIEEQANNAGITTSEYIRNLALTHKTPVAKNRIDTSTFVELNRVGVSLRQLSTMSNAQLDETDSSLTNIMSELEMLMKKIDAHL